METGPQFKVPAKELVEQWIEPMTPGLQGQWLIHYTTATPKFTSVSTFSHNLPEMASADELTELSEKEKENQIISRLTCVEQIQNNEFWSNLTNLCSIRWEDCKTMQRSVSVTVVALGLRIILCFFTQHS